MTWVIIPERRCLLCQLDGGSSGKGPGRPFLHICGNLLLVLVAQEEEGESHGGEVELLQQPERFCTPDKKLSLSIKWIPLNRVHLNKHPHAYSRHAKNSGVEIQWFDWIFNPQHRLLHHEILRQTQKFNFQRSSVWSFRPACGQSQDYIRRNDWCAVTLNTSSMPK